MIANLYINKRCNTCQKLISLLENNGIDFNLIDISFDLKKASYLLEKTGDVLVPTIEINSQFIIGFNIDEIKTTFNIKEITDG